jgi:DNA-binding MarR family transcriptional regulator
MPDSRADVTVPAQAPLRLAAFLPYRLSLLAERISRAFAARYQLEFGLTIPEWRIMAVLGEDAPCSTQAVIERTGLDRVKVSRAVIRLAGKGLLARRPHPADQRAQLLRLSRSGLAVYRRIVPLAHRMQADLAAALTEAEQRELDRILRKLHVGTSALIDAAGGNP